jgi:hypothetical protein
MERPLAIVHKKPPRNRDEYPEDRFTSDYNPLSEHAGCPWCGQSYYGQVLDVPETKGLDKALTREIVSRMGDCRSHPDKIEIERVS